LNTKAEVATCIEFLRELERDMRRAERSGSALSLVVFQLNPTAAPDTRDTDALVSVLAVTKRDTDLLGRIDEHMVALSCPETGPAGLACVVRRLESVSASLPHATLTATYPDSLFASLARLDDTVDDLPLQLIEGAASATRATYAGKRWLDIVGALLAILMLAPMMLLVAGAVALGSPGPVVFRQTRLGRDGVPFTFYKFRSMRVGSDDRIHRDYVARLIRSGSCAEPADAKTEDAAAGDGGAACAACARCKLCTDPRVTPLGRWMRKTSIDELPQLFNVLKGDMSLVGPRPAIGYEVAYYRPWHLRRLLSARPGLTGMWQVDGRSRVSFDDMVRMDLRYIRDCSFRLDLAILFKTVGAVLRCDGAV
jgi:lipopolysaccharide/colanic/teichoic acid biosynthesis glycosyltransferase